MNRLNPYAKTQRALEVKAVLARRVARKANIKAKHSKAGRKAKATRTSRHNALAAGLETSFVAAQQIIDDEIKAGQYNEADAE